MLRAVLFASAAVLLLAARSSSALFIFNNDDDDDMQFSNSFFSVTKVKCFGAVIGENNDEDFETESDICVIGVVGGLILLIALYPFLLSQGAPAQILRRRQSHEIPSHLPTEFANPAESLPAQRQQSTFSRRLSSFFSPLVQQFKSSASRFTDSVQERLSEASLYDVQHKEQQQQQQAAPAAAEAS